MLEPLFEADKAAKINRTRGEDEKGFWISPPIIREVRTD